MALTYFDTSAIVPAFVKEESTDRVHALLDRLADGDVAISDWVRVEFASAISLKHKTGAIDEETARAAMTAWQAFGATSRSVTIDTDSFDVAASYCERAELDLRAGDAFHLAIVAAAGLTLATLDDRLAKAATVIGVPLATF